MLVVLMALIELGKTKVNKATRWLWLALSGGLFVGPAGCEFAKGDADPGATADVVEGAQDPAPEPQPLYGVPEDFVPPGDADVPQVLYGPPPDATEDVAPVDVADVADAQDIKTDCQPAMFYGPAPCVSDEQCAKEYGAGWYCATNEVPDGCGGTFKMTGCEPPPTDVVTPDVPADVNLDCLPGDMYGPPPCTSDQDCRDMYRSADWYCDKANTIPGPCGQISWPACKQYPVDVVTPDQPVEVPDCGPAMKYGPMPLYGMPACEVDDDCVKQGYPAGTTCVKDPCPPYGAECLPPDK